MHNRDRKISASRRKLAMELRLKGLSYAEIAKALGVTRQRAQQYVRPPKALYDAIRHRAKRRCERCEVTLDAGHIHHKKAMENYNSLDNLEYLCVSCHQKEHLVVRSDAAAKWHQTHSQRIANLRSLTGLRRESRIVSLALQELEIKLLQEQN